MSDTRLQPGDDSHVPGSLIRLLTGHDKSDIFPERQEISDETLLRVEELTTQSGEAPI